MKLNYRQTLLVGLGFFSICAFWQMYDHIIPLILKYTFNVKDSVAGGIMAIDNVLALFMLPLFGALSDRTNTKIGRRMPFIVFGTIGACLFMLLIPYANNIHSLPLFIVGLALTLISMAVYRSPAVALMPDVTVSSLRSKGNAIINLVGVLGGILVLGLTGVFLPDDPVVDAAGNVIYNPNYFPMFLCCMVIMVISVAVLFFTINEVKLSAKMEADSKRLGFAAEDESKDNDGQKEKVHFKGGEAVSFAFLLLSIVFWFMGYNAVTTHFSKYCLEIFGMGAGTSALVLIVAQAGAIVTFIPSAMLASKIGRKKTIMAGIVLLAISFGASAFFSSFTPLIYVFFATAGMAWACINVNSLPMVLEFAKKNQIGSFTGFYYTASMSAQIVTPILSGMLLDINYRTLLPYGAVLVLLSLVTMMFVKHGDVKPEKPQNNLEVFEEI